MTENKIAKPFLKWAGGKTPLINDIERGFRLNLFAHFSQKEFLLQFTTQLTA